MKKFLMFLLAFMVIATSVAFASDPVYTVTSRDRYTDDQGNNVIRTRGTIAMTSAYINNYSNSGRIGYQINPAWIGMNSISMMTIPVVFAKNVGASGSYIGFKHTGTGLSGGGVSGGTIVGFYTSVTTASMAVGFASLPSYDLSDLTAVPFEAIGA